MQLKPTKPTLITFVKAGSETHQPRAENQMQPHLLSYANDWKLLVDLPDSNYVFPPEIYSTNERPDIIIWSPKLKTVILLELTCPEEEGIQAAKIRKQSRYMPLMDNISRDI